MDLGYYFKIKAILSRPIDWVGQASSGSTLIGCKLQMSHVKRVVKLMILTRIWMGQVNPICPVFFHIKNKQINKKLEFFFLVSPFNTN